mmetsp:Transcript_29285/g.76875  ORF Transcript_29285/g.76875 Transcript_29285/m.76875 type:complete len:233 (-) Transcript_29285:2483-3181(-)
MPRSKSGNPDEIFLGTPSPRKGTMPPVVANHPFHAVTGSCRRSWEANNRNCCTNNRNPHDECVARCWPEGLLQGQILQQQSKAPDSVHEHLRGPRHSRHIPQDQRIFEIGIAHYRTVKVRQFQRICHRRVRSASWLPPLQGLGDHHDTTLPHQEQLFQANHQLLRAIDIYRKRGHCFPLFAQPMRVARRNNGRSVYPQSLGHNKVRRSAPENFLPKFSSRKHRTQERDPPSI